MFACRYEETVSKKLTFNLYKNIDIFAIQVTERQKKNLTRVCKTQQKFSRLRKKKNHFFLFFFLELSKVKANEFECGDEFYWKVNVILKCLKNYQLPSENIFFRIKTELIITT